MKTLVIGANGQIGRLFCKLYRESGHEVRAMLRNPDQFLAFEQLDVETVAGDLEGDFAQAFDGCERVVFTAGSGGKTGGDKTLMIDLYGAIRSIDESARRGVSHFVMISALRADQPLAGPPAIRHYMVAKKLADEHLVRSGVPHTILRPGRLTDAAASGRVRTDGEGIDISRANVALCIAAALEQRDLQSRTVDLLDGDTPIAEVFPG
jgi:uncharacterized protein YbjT (DUF2867 family)